GAYTRRGSVPRRPRRSRWTSPPPARASRVLLGCPVKGAAARAHASRMRGMHVPLRRLASAALAVAALWSWPTAAPHPIARPFLAPATPYASGHRGIDVRAAAGDEVHAPADGIVHFAGVVVDRPVLSIDQ